MKRFIALLACIGLWGSAYAEQPLQPIVVDGSSHEWQLVGAQPFSMEIGTVRSFYTNDFLYVLAEADQKQSAMTLGMKGSSNKIRLNIETNSGVIYLGSHGLRVPFFDGVLGIESATKGNDIEIRVPLGIFGSDVSGKDFRIQMSSKVEKFQPEPMIRKQSESPWTVGGVSKLDAVLHQEKEGVLHIRLMEDRVSPLSAVQHIAKWEMAEAAEILRQIKDSNQPNLKPWALTVLATADSPGNRSNAPGGFETVKRDP